MPLSDRNALETGTEGMQTERQSLSEDTASETAVRLATFDQYRGLLFSVAYRMLGSVADAEDMLQETFLRWQRASIEEIRSPRAFLVTIISRLAINHLQSARVEREEYFGEWLPEPLVADEGKDPLSLLRMDETLSMAFLVLLERLTPVERAVFLLREVFEYEYAEIASMLGQSEVNCRQLLRRARQHVTKMRPRGLGRLKEWAYAAFGIVVLSACYSHLLSGDGVMALEPLVTGAALVISYMLRPTDRRMGVVSQVAVRV